MRLHFQSYGQGPPLIILHGLFGSLDNWHRLSQLFGAHLHVFALDQRNHGRSPHSPEIDYPLMAQDLNEFVETVLLPLRPDASHASPAPFRVSVLGHSMGGKTAMEFALRYPHRVEQLIVADIAPRAYSPRHETILRALRALDLNASSSRQQMETALAPDLPDLAVRRFLLKNVAHQPGGGFHWRLNLDAIQKNYPRLGEALAPGRRCDRPALFLRGEKSNYVRHEDIALIHQLFPNARLQTIPGASHWLHADAPDLFRQAVLDFLGIPA